jgi:hypothetical protein
VALLTTITVNVVGVAWCCSPPYRAFGGVVAHATVSVVQWVVLVSRWEIFNFQVRENKKVDLK